jgi:PKD repeat protein
LPVAVQPHSDAVPPTAPVPSQPPPDRGPSAPLTVALTVSTTTLGTPTTFFASVAGGAPQRLSWSFGDGARDEGTSPSTGHLYAAIGSYQASVTVQDEFGRTASASAIAVVGAPAPAPMPTPSPSPSPQPPANTPRYDVTISISPSFVHVGDTVTVTANINPQFTPPPIASITFSCGGLGAMDPRPSLASSAPCTYARQGDVTISVTVTDGGSTTTTATKQLTVQQ